MMPPQTDQVQPPQTGNAAEAQAQPTAAPPPPPPPPPRPSPAAMPVPRPVPAQPPSTVASLDAVPKDAKRKTTLAMIWFFISGIIFIAAGSYLYALLRDAIDHEKPVDQGAMWAFIGVMFVFGVLAILLAIITQMRVLNSMRAEKWDTAVDTMMFLAIPGIIFGFAISGILLFMANKRMRSHPFYLRTLPPPTPVCERCRQPVQWNAAMKKWYCPNCKIYL